MKPKDYQHNDFADISAEVYLRQQRAKMWEKKNYPKDEPKSWFERIAILVCSAIFGIALSCAVVLNWPIVREAAYHTAIYLDSIPTGYQTAIAAFLLIVCIFSWRIVKSAKSSRG